MAKPTLILSMAIIALMAFTSKVNVHQFPSDDLEIPENVQAIIDDKCYGCHNPESKSDKAKDKLLWNELSNLSKVKLISILDEISEVIDEGEMPPEKFLEKYPDKKLTDEEASLLKDWAIKTANKQLE